MFCNSGNSDTVSNIELTGVVEKNHPRLILHIKHVYFYTIGASVTSGPMCFQHTMCELRKIDHGHQANGDNGTDDY